MEIHISSLHSRSVMYAVVALVLVSGGFFVLEPRIVAAVAVTMGETLITPNSDSGNANLLLAQKATLAQAATLQSLSFYVTSAGGKLRLGVYDATGPGGGPGAKIAETAEMTPVVGWNTGNVLVPVNLAAGTYWLTYIPSSNALGFRNDQTGSDKYYSYTYGALPTTFSTSPSSGTFHFSLYATLTASPDVIAPTTPANLAATAVSASQINLSWTASSDNVSVAGYKVFRNGVQIATTTAISYSDTGLTASTTYTYVLSAFDPSQNESVRSAPVVSKTQALPVVDTVPPTGSIVINVGAASTKSTASVLSLAATDLQNAVTQMRFSNTGTSFNAAIAYTTTSNWTLTTGDGTKTVYVQFKDAVGNWSGSFTDTIVLDTVAPTISAVTSSNISGNSATITWTTNEPATSQVEYGPTTSYGSLTTIDNTLVTSHNVVVSGLTSNKTYNYRVRSKDAATNEKLGSNATFKTTAANDTSAPSVPTNLTASAITTSAATLSWTASTDNVGVTSYNVFRDGVQIATSTTTSYQNTGLTPATTYAYTIAARDAAGNVSAQSASVNATTLAPDTTTPSIPSNLTATAISSSQINLSWLPATDDVAVAGYKIFRNGTQVGTAPSNAYSDSGLTASTAYQYAVSAYDAAANNSDQSVSASATTLVASLSTPTLIQHVASSANPPGLGITGNNFKIPLPNSVGAGDCLVLGITYPNGSTPIVTDNNGNTWPASAAVSANAGAGGNVSSIWVLPNAKAGQTVLTVSFPSPIIPFNYTVSEFNNIDAVNPVNGTAARANVSGAVLTTGTFTPGNNDQNGGNLIWNYYAVSSLANHNPTTWTPGSNFALLDADISWISNQGFPHASQYSIQSAAAAINPSIAPTGDSGDAFNAVAVALRAASAGTPAPMGIHINKIIHQTTNIGVSTWALQEPATGNLRVLATANGNNLTNITSITDSDGGTWTKVEPQGDEPQIWYSANTSPNPNLKITLHVSGENPTISVLFYDIVGAAANPFDVAAGSPTVDSSGRSTLTASPLITPTTPNGLVIAVVGLGQGPGIGLDAGAPSGAVFDLVTYSGEFDEDLMENADGQAHVYNADTTPLNWNWRISATSPNSTFSTAVAFKSAGH